MVTDTDKMVAELDNPLILITDKKISTTQEILPLLEQIVQMVELLLSLKMLKARLLQLSYLTNSEVHSLVLP